MKPLRVCLIILLFFSGCKRENVPKVTTVSISSITQTSATCIGSVISQGDCEMTSKGFYMGTSYNLTSMDSIRVKGSSTGNYVYNLTNLKVGTKYYIRAFATNCYGTGYGDTISFKTGDATVPVVTTSDVTNITCTTATSGGTITSDGASQIIDRGLCWGTSENPTMYDNYISLEENRLNPFSYTIRSLGTNSNYYVRAYATNSAGTGYGESIQFCTKSLDPNYNPNSIIGTWNRYGVYGDLSGFVPTGLGATFITEVTKDSIQIDRAMGIIVSNHRFTISGSTLIELNETGGILTEYSFLMSITGDTLTYIFGHNNAYEYFSRLY